MLFFLPEFAVISTSCKTHVCTHCGILCGNLLYLKIFGNMGHALNDKEANVETHAAASGNTLRIVRIDDLLGLREMHITPIRMKRQSRYRWRHQIDCGSLKPLDSVLIGQFVDTNRREAQSSE
jgi:hypothetical protein